MGKLKLTWLWYLGATPGLLQQQRPHLASCSSRGLTWL